MSGRQTRATVALVRAGVHFAVHEYAHTPGGDSYGREAAEALRVDPGRVLKTLLAAADGRPTVAIVPVTGSLDLRALAAAVQARRAALLEPAEAERLTGYVRGGISPLGQRRRLPTVVDSSALGHDTVYVSAGRRGLEVELPATDLVRLTGAVVAGVARPG